MYFTAGAQRSKVSQPSFFHNHSSDRILPSYLHINGFIHRDVKAANLLIDDDGTVLLGDLGVAADLSEESSQHIHASHLGKAVTATTALNQMQPRRLVAFDGGNIKGRPKIGKRKSFVGTVCLCLSAD